MNIKRELDKEVEKYKKSRKYNERRVKYLSVLLEDVKEELEYIKSRRDSHFERMFYTTNISDCLEEADKVSFLKFLEDQMEYALGNIVFVQEKINNIRLEHLDKSKRR